MSIRPTSGCPWSKATVKSPVGARDLRPMILRNSSSEEIEIPKSWSRLEIRYSQRNWKCLAALPCPAPALQDRRTDTITLALQDGRTDTTVALIYMILCCCLALIYMILCCCLWIWKCNWIFDTTTVALIYMILCCCLWIWKCNWIFDTTTVALIYMILCCCLWIWKCNWIFDSLQATLRISGWFWFMFSYIIMNVVFPFWPLRIKWTCLMIAYDLTKCKVHEKWGRKEKTNHLR